MKHKRSGKARFLTVNVRMAIIGLTGDGDGEDAGATAADTAARLTEGEEERRPIVDDPTRTCVWLHALLSL